MAPKVEDSLTLLRPYSKADVFVRPVSAIRAGALRLEAGFYGSQGYRAVQAMEDSGFRIERVDQHAKVRWFGPFSRTYVDSPEAGVPFLTSSTMLRADAEPGRYISKALTRDLQRLVITEGTVLVSCSGTIGNTAICTRDTNGFAVSQDAIRINANSNTDTGVLLVSLLSDVGKFLLTRNKSGSVIEHLYAEDVGQLPFPLLPIRLRQRISEDIEKASSLRVEANRLLKEAEKRVQVEIGLPSYQSFNQVRSVNHGKYISTTYIVNSRRVIEARDQEGHARLDATFYEPRALELRRFILASGGVSLGDVVPSVILIGKTFVEGVHKVEREHGFPYFTGKELFKTRTVAETFITSRRRAAIDRLIVKRGTTLITCAGTVGKVAYVRGPLEESTVTHDAIRVLPGKRVHPGYVFAFLNSPYGRVQLNRCAYGSVIPRLYRTHIEKVVLPIPGDHGDGIGCLVDQAFDYRADALAIENEAINIFLRALQQGRDLVETEWGREY